MEKTPIKKYDIRRADQNEYELLGQMTVKIYERLPGMPGVAEQPGYYGKKKSRKRGTSQVQNAVTLRE